MTPPPPCADCLVSEAMDMHCYDECPCEEVESDPESWTGYRALWVNFAYPGLDEESVPERVTRVCLVPDTSDVIVVSSIFQLLDEARKVPYGVLLHLFRAESSPVTCKGIGIAVSAAVLMQISPSIMSRSPMNKMKAVMACLGLLQQRKYSAITLHQRGPSICPELNCVSDNFGRSSLNANETKFVKLFHDALAARIFMAKSGDDASSFSSIGDVVSIGKRLDDCRRVGMSFFWQVSMSECMDELLRSRRHMIWLFSRIRERDEVIKKLTEIAGHKATRESASLKREVTLTQQMDDASDLAKQSELFSSSRRKLIVALFGTVFSACDGHLNCDGIYEAEPWYSLDSLYMDGSKRSCFYSQVYNSCTLSDDDPVVKTLDKYTGIGCALAAKLEVHPDEVKRAFDELIKKIRLFHRPRVIVD